MTWKKILEKIRPFLQIEGGNVELVDVIQDGVVKVKLTGACKTCSMSIYTLKIGIEQRLKEEVVRNREVIAV